MREKRTTLTTKTSLLSHKKLLGEEFLPGVLLQNMHTLPWHFHK